MESFRSEGGESATDSTDSHPISRSLSHSCPKTLGAPQGGLERGKLLTVAQVAERLGLCRATVYRLVAEGELPHIRVGNSIRLLPLGCNDIVMHRC